MRLALLASATVLALATALPAFAQTATTGPMSNSATNLDTSDTHSVISPRLPAPDVPAGAGPRQFLAVAKTALQRGRTGEAQSALEMAETRLLDRSIVAGSSPVDNGPMVGKISDALTALGNGDRARASQIVDGLLASSGSASTSQM